MFCLFESPHSPPADPSRKRTWLFHEPCSSGRESAHYSPTGKVRADSRRLLRGSWSRCTRVSERMLSMNLVAADVSPLTYRPRAKLEPTDVGLLRFMVPMRGIRPWGLSMNRGLNLTGSVSSLSPRGTSGERAGERGNQAKTASSPRPSPPSFLRRRGRSRRFMVPRHAQKRKGAFHEPRSSGRESAHLSPVGKVRADSRRLLRFLVPMRGRRPWPLSMNLVAADVSPLTIRPRAKLEPTHVGCYRSWSRCAAEGRGRFP